MKSKLWLLTHGNALLAIVFGLIALLFPSVALKSLALFFSVFLLIGGFLQAINAISLKRLGVISWSTVFLQGVIEAILGLVILFNPTEAASVFMVILGIWSLLLGAIILVSQLKAPSSAKRNIILLTSLVIIVFGLIITIHPFESTRLITVIIGFFALIYGISSISGLYKIVKQ